MTAEEIQSAIIFFYFHKILNFFFLIILKVLKFSKRNVNIRLPGSRLTEIIFGV